MRGNTAPKKHYPVSGSLYLRNKEKNQRKAPTFILRKRGVQFALSREKRRRFCVVGEKKKGEKRMNEKKVC